MQPALRSAILDVLATTPAAVAAAYLFGSVARGDDRAESDVDLAVLFEALPARTLAGPRFALEGEFERALKRRVDLIVLNDAPVDLRIRVLREGELLLERNRSARIAFEVRTRNEYFDLEPVLALYRSPRRQP